MKYIAVSDLEHISKDVVLKNGAKHRCIDATQIYELPKVDIILCDECRYQSTCIHTVYKKDGEGFCKWGKAKDGDRE